MGHVSGIAYVRYQAPDLDLMENFLLDFGMIRSVRTASALYMRGTGPNHHLHITELGEQSRGIGIGMIAASLTDLEEIAASAGATIEESNEPGGGLRAILTDPNGFRVDIIHGQQQLEPLPVRMPLILNNSLETNRVGKVQRPEPGPSHVARTEHAVLIGPNFAEALDFYENTLGMKISDRSYDGHVDNTVAAFIRCGLGDGYTDHHTIGLLNAPMTGFEHCAFISLDWDDVMLGHEHLKAAGYSHAWGVGRHTLGSEVFDYWLDPFGNKVEHTSDGDMLNDSHVAGDTPIELENYFIWAPPPVPRVHEEPVA